MKEPTPKQELIAQGAEAKILKEGNFVIKNRISKSYRHPEIDKKLIKQRTKREFNILEKAYKLGISPKPALEGLDKIKMPFIEGKKLSQELENLDYIEICKIIGNNIAKLHDNNIIHGDLTTSNMIFVSNPAKKSAPTKKATKNSTINNKVVFIDFGLGFTSERFEDRAVDLHLIKQALEAKHHTIYKECWKIIEENYNSKDRANTLAQLKKVESRGRYKKGE
ncbi:Kae1-associated serine/threonine protein kinase [Candidatus Pacearchaeota archaeon]|nr:Kae1-associated serine/threonine protein kinase [Candidatus Pacearchaeota archaeon]